VALEEGLVSREIERFLAGAQRDVDAALDRLLPPASAEPPAIHEALRYAVFPGGKRVRPALVLLAGEAVGGSTAPLLDAAAGFELIHTASLILDDLPSQDDAPMRRGREATHIRFGEATAVLASTALLTLGIKAISENARREGAPAGTAARVVRLVADAIGTAGMIGGQVADLALDSAGGSMEALEYIHSHKTGALFIACAEVGALLAGGKPGEVAALAAFAKNVGLAYQIADDILDVEGEAARLGKPTGQDARKTTFVRLFGLDVSRRLARDLYDSAEKSLDVLGSRKERLLDFTRWLEARAS
jgi:geranylgeranyl diphosphate synthase type II